MKKIKSLSILLLLSASLFAQTRADLLGTFITGARPSQSKYQEWLNKTILLPDDSILIVPSQIGKSGKFLTTNGTRTSWQTPSGGGAFTKDSVSKYAWSLTGNSGTTAGTNFVGTTDSVAVQIHSFKNHIAPNHASMLIKPNGFWDITSRRIGYPYFNVGNDYINFSDFGGVQGMIATFSKYKGDINEQGDQLFMDILDTTTQYNNSFYQGAGYGLQWRNGLFTKPQSVSGLKFAMPDTTNLFLYDKNILWWGINRATGMEVNRKAKFDSTITIADGTQGANKVFTSDANGLGSWQVNAASSLNLNQVLTNGNNATGLGANNLGNLYSNASGNFYGYNRSANYTSHLSFTNSGINNSAWNLTSRANSDSTTLSGGGLSLQISSTSSTTTGLVYLAATAANVATNATNYSLMNRLYNDGRYAPTIAAGSNITLVNAGGITTINAGGGSGWSLTGNSGMVAGTNFIGTTDDISLIFKTNNIERLRIDSASGNVGVGTPSPLAKLDVVNTNTIIPTLQLYSNTTTYNAGQDLAICVNNANTDNNFVVAHNGQVGINTLPSAAYFLDVNGGIHSSTFARINGVSIGTMWGGQPSEINTDHTDTGNDLYLNYTNGGAVGVSTNSVHASAILDCESVTRGFLPPQMTTLQKLAIGTPKEGLIVYDLTLHQISYYNGSTWVNL